MQALGASLKLNHRLLTRITSLLPVELWFVLFDSWFVQLVKQYQVGRGNAQYCSLLCISVCNQHTTSISQYLAEIYCG